MSENWMLKKCLLVLTVFLLAADATILYIWLAKWQKLATIPGMLGWGIAFLSGLLLYMILKKLSSGEKMVMVFSRLALGSAILLGGLAVLTVLITLTVRSMP